MKNLNNKTGFCSDPKGDVCFDLDVILIVYFLGEIFAISSSFAFEGPQAHCIRIVSDWEVLTSFILLLSSVVALIVVAVKAPLLPLVITMVVIEKMTSTWYTLAYIPYAHECVRACFCRPLWRVVSWCCCRETYVAEDISVEEPELDQVASV